MGRACRAWKKGAGRDDGGGRWQLARLERGCLADMSTLSTRATENDEDKASGGVGKVKVWCHKNIPNTHCRDIGFSE